ncbi:MAG: SDR family NAD(P)-dependent oxidoreductase [Pedosphaera sp.]|nr:SDR family NAD(P)-dependent oxidoreductase [Pedosphaera sp.]
MQSGSKIVVLTGVTRGLGRAMADEFVRLGHTVIGCGRSRAEIETLTNQFPKPHDFAVVDITSNEQVQAWADQIFKTHRAPDFLLNNAGVINRNAPLWEISAQEFSRVIEVNLNGTANVIRHFIPPMIKSRKGVIINFSSGWGRSTSRDVAPYCATKWGVEGLTQALAQELPSGLAAIALNPGIINTAMLRSCFGDSAASYPTAVNWARIAVPFILKLDGRHSGQPLSVPGI